MRRCALWFLLFFVFDSVIAANERLAECKCGISLYFSSINRLPPVHYELWNLEIVCNLSGCFYLLLTAVICETENKVINICFLKLKLVLEKVKKYELSKNIISSK